MDPLLLNHIGCNQAVARAEVSSEAQLGRVPSLVAVSPGASVLCKMLVRGHCPFFALWVSPPQRGHLLHQSQQG